MPAKRKPTTTDPGEGEPPSKAAKSAAKLDFRKLAKPAAKPKKPTFPANPEHFAKVLSSNHSKWQISLTGFIILALCESDSRLNAAGISFVVGFVVCLRENLCN